MASVGKDVEKREHLCTIGGNVNWCSHEGKVWRFLKKLKIELPYDPAIPLFGIFLKKMKTLDFPGGTVVKNLPVNAGNTGSSPGPGRSHMPQSN